MKNFYRNILYLLTATLITINLSSCNKEDGYISDKKRISSITAVLKSTDTKTLHQYTGSALKTSWKEGDQIVVFDYYGKELFKFTQTGMVYNSGKTSAFIPDDPENFFNSSSIAAIYPYSDNLRYDISTQTGRIEDLNKYDIWEAELLNYDGLIEEETFEFEPKCVVLRIPKGSPITSTDYSGDITLSFSGGSVYNVYDYKNYDPYLHGSITIKTKVNKGAVEEDTFIVFIKVDNHALYHPDCEADGVLKNLYYIDSDRGDHFEFHRTNIGTEKIYTLDTRNSGYVHFEDIEFKTILLNDDYYNIDKNGDNEISYAEAKNATSIEISASTISSFVGLEHFTNITSLKLYSTSEKITNIDFTSNTKLQGINIKCPNLQKIDVSNCPDLGGLTVSGKLQSLDISKNEKLRYLYCSGNQLVELDLSNNKHIWGIDCSNNKLEQFKLPNNIPQDVGEGEGYYITIDCSNNKLKTLNLKDFKCLEYLDCSNNNISVFDLPLQSDFLRVIKCNNNAITALNLASYKALYAVDCSNNNLQKLICPPNVKSIFCANNNLTNLDLLDLSKLHTVGSWGNNIEELNVSKWGININLIAWPMKNNSLKKVFKLKDKKIYFELGPMEYELSLSDLIVYDDFHYRAMGEIINPADYGTTVIEVD